MDKFLKYKDCKHLICHNTFTIQLDENIYYTFHKGVKYDTITEVCDCDYYITFYMNDIDIEFESNNDDDVKNVIENFHTLSEYREFNHY